MRPSIMRQSLPVTRSMAISVRLLPVSPDDASDEAELSWLIVRPPITGAAHDESRTAPPANSRSAALIATPSRNQPQPDAPTHQSLHGFPTPSVSACWAVDKPLN